MHAYVSHAVKIKLSTVIILDELHLFNVILVMLIDTLNGQPHICNLTETTYSTITLFHWLHSLTNNQNIFVQVALNIVLRLIKVSVENKTSKYV